MLAVEGGLSNLMPTRPQANRYHARWMKSDPQTQAASPSVNSGDIY